MDIKKFLFLPFSLLIYYYFFVIFLGIQSLAQVVALSQEIKGSPATVMDNMSKSDLLNCQHSLTELILTGYAQKVIELLTAYFHDILTNSEL